MKRLRFRLLAALSIQLIILLLAQSAFTEGNVTLVFTSYQREYILHEPVHFTGALINNSDHTVNIYHMEKFDENMECTFLEIQSPDGSKTKRRSSYGTSLELLSPKYLGQMLKPGNTFTFDIFPNRSQLLTYPHKGGWTFPEPGTYKVRLAYIVEEFRENLWKPEGNVLYSNQITLRIKSPSPIEREILDAYWDGVSVDWDGTNMSGFNTPELQIVLGKYPNEPLIKYVHFALLNASYTIDGPDFQMASMHFEHLVINYPNFRPGQIRRRYAGMLIHGGGRREEGLRILEEALSLKPGLKDDYRLMKLKINTEAGNGSAFWKWRRTKSQKIPNLDKEMDKE